MRIQFAKRLRDLSPSLTLEIAAQAKRDPEVINLSVGEPDFNTPEKIKEAGVEAIRHDFTNYTAAAGIQELREAVAKRVSRETGIPRSAGEVLVSNGAKHAIANAILTLVDRGDRVLIPTPYWLSYPEMVYLAEGEVIKLETELDNGFRLTPAQLAAALATDPKLIILNSPSNPTGAAYSREHLDSLVPLLKEAGVFIISDEIYDKLLFEGRKHASLASYPEIRDQVILAGGVSKTYCMTGWRIGWVVGHPDIIAQMSSLQSQMTSSPCSISQKAALEAVNGTEDNLPLMINAFAQRRTTAVQMLREIPGVKCHPPEGAFYLFPDISAYLPASEPSNKPSGRSLALALYLLRRHKVAVIPGMVFGNDDHIRISFAASMDDLVEGIKRIAQGLENYRQLTPEERRKFAQG